MNNTKSNPYIKNLMGTDAIKAIGTKLNKIFLNAPKQIVSGFIENCLILLLNHPATEKFWNQNERQCIIKSIQYHMIVPMINDMINKRAIIYKEAKYKIECDDLNKNEISKKILSLNIDEKNQRINK